MRPFQFALSQHLAAFFAYAETRFARVWVAFIYYDKSLLAAWNEAGPPRKRLSLDPPIFLRQRQLRLRDAAEDLIFKLINLPAATREHSLWANNRHGP